MILILSGLLDEAGLAWKSKFPAGSAFMLKPDNFSTGDICVFAEEIESSYIMLEGTRINMKDIRGVLSLTQSYLPDEFIQFESDTKTYAASEINALMIFVLHQLKCKMINPPSVNSFSGPGWQFEDWYRIALSNKIPCLPFVRNNNKHQTFSESYKIHSIDCVEDNVVNSNSAQLSDYTQKLKRASKLAYLNASFLENANGEFYFNGVNLIPNVLDEKLNSQITEYFNHA